MKSAAIEFKNEFGNGICIGIERYFDPRSPMLTMVRYQIRGPTTQTVNTITIKEAEMLRDLLNEILPTQVT